MIALLGAALANGGPDAWTQPTPVGDARPDGTVRTRLASERLEVRFGVDFDRVHATATYRLVNDGAPETVRYAVPLLGEKPPTPTLTLDGKAVSCTLEPLAKAIPLFADTYEMFDPVAERVCVASLAVPSGASTLVLDVVEEPFHESWSTSKDLHAGVADRDWVWMLAPAGSWKGTVDTLDVVLDPGALGDRVQPKTAGFERREGRWVLHREKVDLAAAEPLHVHLAVADMDRQAIVLGMAKRGFWMKPVSARASSTLAAQGGNRYDAANVFDADPSTAWCEGVEGSGKGSWLEIRFAPPTHIEDLPVYVRMGPGPLAMAVIPGYAKSASAWAGNGRVRELKVSTCDGKTSDTVALAVAEDWKAGLVTHRFGGSFKDDTMPTAMAEVVTKPWMQEQVEACVRVELTGVVDGGKWADTCISELLFWPETF
ncbi:MAG: hypothetical protein H6736_19835 [Alphaproteobacteria bacterium]|nr:hypothetical protein [Alphaproteobacteria bacterium]